MCAMSERQVHESPPPDVGLEGGWAVGSGGGHVPQATGQAVDAATPPVPFLPQRILVFLPIHAHLLLPPKVHEGSSAQVWSRRPSETACARTVSFATGYEGGHDSAPRRTPATGPPQRPVGVETRRRTRAAAAASASLR